MQGFQKQRDQLNSTMLIELSRLELQKWQNTELIANQLHKVCDFLSGDSLCHLRALWAYKFQEIIVSNRLLTAFLFICGAEFLQQQEKEDANYKTENLGCGLD